MLSMFMAAGPTRIGIRIRWIGAVLDTKLVNPGSRGILNGVRSLNELTELVNL
jgi:hypothetical protein